MASRFFKPLATLLLAPLALALLAAAALAIFGWNWARGPLQDAVHKRTGRALVIGGDLHVGLGWPNLHVRAQRVTFANPPWANAPQMLVLDAADVDIDLPSLWHGLLLFPMVRLSHPIVMLETTSDGRKTWLLDAAQSDENQRSIIGLLTLDQGRLGIDDRRVNTRILLDMDTPDASTGNVVFSVSGLFKGLALAARGHGGPVLSLRDEHTPYPLEVDATIGPTTLSAKGSITGLLSMSAVDLQVAVRGDSLAQLFPLLGIGLPATHDYVTGGRLVHSGKTWSYENFGGRIGQSDVAGRLQVDAAGARPMLQGTVTSQVLDFADLGPSIGVTDVKRAAAATAEAGTASAPAAARRRVLPDLPFQTERWRQFDADVTLRAARILRDKALPLGDFTAHMHMQDAVLTLDPLDFGVAGGHLQAKIRLDARQGEIQGSAQVQARQLLLNQLFPTLVLTKTSVGQINGQFDLAGHGNSVGRLLATADGHLRLVVGQGEISRLLMEQVGLHLLEILQLSLVGDQTIRLNCAVADFSLKQGRMAADTLVLDTAVNTVVGSGSIDLGQETLDLTLVPRTRSTSLVALRSPIHVGGTLGAPVATLDKTRLLARGAGALALGLVNPLLALIPLVETGPGLESGCAPPQAQPKAPVKPPVPAAASRSDAQTPR